VALTSGTNLGPYEIQSALGHGGMGEVYRAKDTRLDRTVAVKILATHLSSSPELKQRLEREARAISALNHPHICHLYDIGSQNGTDYLVMEFLEGETLADRLRRGAMPLAEVYRVGSDIAEALDVAHRQGIVHRDLKPGNIMLTKSGAKLMDFGLAKPLAASVASSSVPPSFTAVATMSGPSPLSPLTTAGSIVGTIQYMSPEQIEGKEADARSDIFALGAVLYEMASAKRPFEGKSQISLASAILEKDPAPITALTPQAPRSFEYVLTTCLQKNPEDRFQSAQDVKLQLRWIAAEKPLQTTVSAPSLRGVKKRELGLWVAIGLLAAALVAVGAFPFLHRAQPKVLRTSINAPEKHTINLMGDYAGPPVLSPDGTMVVFAASDAEGKGALWVRSMNSPEARPLPDTDGAIFPFWSPDNHSIGFFAASKLKTIEIGSSSSQTIADAPFGRGGAWTLSGVILFASNTQTQLFRVNASGGAVSDLTTINHTQHTSHRWPFVLPDGKHFLYLAIHHDPAKTTNDEIYYASLDGKENRPLFHCQTNAIYASGYILFARDDQLMAQPFDPAHGNLTGTAQVVARGIANDVSTWHMDASATDDGLLVFGSGGSADWQLVWANRGGNQITPIAEKLPNLQDARVSPQGDRIALEIDNAQSDIWTFDLARGVRTRLTFGPVQNSYPIWSPDSKWIAYISGRNGHSQIYRKHSDGSGEEEMLMGDEQQVITNDWSRDGKYIIFSRGTAGGTWQLWALPLQGDRKPFMVVAHAAFSLGASGSLSPDGKWIAYASDESGNVESYVAAFNGGQGKWQVSSNGGTRPQWSSDSKELYYMDPTYTLLAVPVKQVNGALQFGTPQTLVKNWSAPQVFYDVSPDGKRILLDRIAQQVSQSITLMTNFAAAAGK
jgi:eukaryotic-like serine/threonine-protein kinase